MKKLLLAILFSGCLIGAKAQLLSEKKESNTFDLSVATAIYVDSSEETLVKKSAGSLQQDIEAVTGKRLPLIHSADHAATNIILRNDSAVIPVIVVDMGGNVAYYYLGPPETKK